MAPSHRASRGRWQAPLSDRQILRLLRWTFFVVACLLFALKVPTLSTFDGLSLLIVAALVLAGILWVEETA